MRINEIEFDVQLDEVVTELQSQLASNGIELLQRTKPTPSDIMVACPYHKNGTEKKPSAGIRRYDGLFHCFACNEIHSLPEVISHCFGYTNDFIGAFGTKWLLKNFTSIKAEERDDFVLDFSRGSNSSVGSKDYVSEEELDSYRYTHPYMYKRKLTDDVIEMFDIGYDKKTQCITFPIRDISGGTLFIARRSVNTKYFNYPSGVEKPLYGIYEYMEYFNAHNGIYVSGMRSGKTLMLHNMTEVIVCESMLDALVFWTIGRCAVALNGLGTDLQFKQLNELPCRKLILCTDSDKAGMEARARIRKHCSSKLITEYILPIGVKDANDCTQEQLMHLEEII